MNVYKGRRWSAASAYLRPAMRRKNLKVICNATATRILFQEKRAVGVEYLVKGKHRQIKAHREVILASGPFNNPKLLMLSGVGPREELERHNIQTIHHRPGVGENLQDHLSIYLQVQCKKPVTLNAIGPFRKAKIGAQWLLKKNGLGATNHFECGGFIRSKPGIKRPDIELHFLPVAVRESGDPRQSEHGFQADVGPTKSKSRGHVRLASKDPLAPPKITLNAMGHPDDWKEMRACVRLAREIFRQAAFDEFRGEELVPGAHVQDDAEIDEFIRNNVASGFHPSGTCKIGSPEDDLAVVDPDLRVIGIENLRIADSSVIPVITNANLNAPTIMIAEKAADIILGRPPLAPINAPFYEPKDWEASQR